MSYSPQPLSQINAQSVDSNGSTSRTHPTPQQRFNQLPPSYVCQGYLYATNSERTPAWRSGLPRPNSQLMDNSNATSPNPSVASILEAARKAAGLPIPTVVERTLPQLLIPPVYSDAKSREHDRLPSASTPSNIALRASTSRMSHRSNTSIGPPSFTVHASSSHTTAPKNPIPIYFDIAGTQYCYYEEGEDLEYSRMVDEFFASYDGNNTFSASSSSSSSSSVSSSSSTSSHPSPSSSSSVPPLDLPSPPYLYPSQTHPHPTDHRSFDLNVAFNHLHAQGPAQHRPPATIPCFYCSKALLLGDEEETRYRHLPPTQENPVGIVYMCGECEWPYHIVHEQEQEARKRKRDEEEKEGASKRVRGVSEGKGAAGTQSTKAQPRGRGEGVKKAAPTRRSKKGKEKENAIPIKTD
ncbi:hypothetical protein BDN70DRAFT_899460 [Pholiota conissans]|uniref:Uncharacterized protein n=1 Tax=Pholiota conissans TaxID=109636 RepID=A0A9P5YRH8_9AGAR|nr:hypothetical protein BDN70DRAFT_899460 [Pholiota conissans]